MSQVIGERWRLVTKTWTGDEETVEEHTSTVVLSKEEAFEGLVVEVQLHHLAGWEVRMLDDRRIVCHRGNSWRVLSVRQFSPMDDR